MPSGVDVRAKGDRILGTTPLDVAIDNETVRSSPRSFALVKDGFAAYSVVQGPSADTVRVLAQLTAIPPVAAADASSVATHGASPIPPTRHVARPGSPSASASGPHPDLDIRMNR